MCMCVYVCVMALSFFILCACMFVCVWGGLCVESVHRCVCMYVCMYVYMYARMFTHVHVCVFVSESVRVYVCLCVCDGSKFVHMCTGMHVCVSECT